MHNSKVRDTIDITHKCKFAYKPLQYAPFANLDAYSSFQVAHVVFHMVRRSLDLELLPQFKALYSPIYILVLYLSVYML
jgi:hypothetical protein